jgi:hypothetical protein
VVLRHAGAQLYREVLLTAVIHCAMCMCIGKGEGRGSHLSKQHSLIISHFNYREKGTGGELLHTVLRESFTGNPGKHF